MTQLIRRSDLEDGNFFVASMWFVAPAVIGLVIGGIAGGIAAVSNSSRRDFYTFIEEIRRPRVAAAGEYNLVAVLLHELAGDQGNLQEYVTIRYGQTPDALALFKEFTDAADKSKQFLNDYPEQVKLALAGELQENRLPHLWGPWRTFFLLLGIGWASGSLMAWLVLCWWYGIFEGHHPYSGLGWNTVGVYAVSLVTLPGVVMNAALVGIFYVVYGILIGITALAWTPEEPPKTDPADAAAYVMNAEQSGIASLSVRATQQPGAAAQQPSPRAEPATPPSPPPGPPPAERNTPQTRLPEDVDEMIRGYQAEREQTLPLFVSLVQQGHARRGALVKDALHTAAAALEQTQRGYVHARAVYDRWKTSDRNVRVTGTLQALYGRLWVHPRVRALHIADGQLCVHPTTTVIPHNGKRYEIGDFVLRIDPKTGGYTTICIRQASGKAIHPFEQTGRGICFGGAAGCLQAFVDNLDYEAFVDYALVMTEQPGKEMHYWRTIE